MAGETLEAAQDAAGAVDPACDIATPMALLFAQNAVTGLITKDPA